MPSRIDIGPEGGPFVAINESSNDLELQDINGNVIAKWDETAGQWDLNNNSLTNINAIDASSATLGSINLDDDIQIATDSAELSNLLADGRCIHLLDKTYNIDEINTRTKIIGTAPGATGAGTDLRPDSSSQVTISSRAHLEGINLREGVDITSDFLATVYNCWLSNSASTISGTGRAQIIACDEVNLTLDNNTEKCVVACNTDSSITDNGTNNIVANNS
jgi:hypothetical protein